MRTALTLFSLASLAAAAHPFAVVLTDDKAPYSGERGVGYEPAPSNPEGTFAVSFKVPEEGNYRVTVTLGDPAKESVTTVKAELRRLMLEQIHTAPGKTETRTFIVNVRNPNIDSAAKVKLKDRELTSEAWAWDDKLTLQFSGANPAFRRIEVRQAGKLPTLYIAGDSTSTDQGREPFNSWGQMITRFFQPDIAVANHGESGESLHSFIAENRLAKLMSVIQPGDWLLIQMGHNDQKDTREGAGAFTTYKADLKRFIAEARQRGATPVLVTPVQRLNFDATGHIVNTLGDFPEAVRQTAAEEKVGLIDLNAMSIPFYEALGPEQAPQAFAPGDKTHHNNYGSYQLAKCVVQGIHDAKLPLAAHLLPGLPAFSPAHPDPLSAFAIPRDPMRPANKPYGN